MNISSAVRSMVQSTRAFDRAMADVSKLHHLEPHPNSVSIDVGRLSARAAQVATTPGFSSVLPASVDAEIFGGDDDRTPALGWSDPRYHQPLTLNMESAPNTAAAASMLVSSLKTIEHYGVDVVRKAEGLQNVEGATDFYVREMVAETRRRIEGALRHLERMDPGAWDSHLVRSDQVKQGIGLLWGATNTADRPMLEGPARELLGNASRRYLGGIQSGRPPQVFEERRPELVADLTRAIELLSAEPSAETWTSPLPADALAPGFRRR